MVTALLATRTVERFAHVRWQGVLPWGLALVLLLVYFPALGSGFLVWDEPWLVDQSVRLGRTSSHEIWSIFTDFSVATRTSLGGEYSPLRDLSHIVEAATVGLQPVWMRIDNLGIYTISILLLRTALLNTLGRKWTTELCVLIFALHPVHVESVAWIAARKDVLALCFTMAMLWAWCKEEGRSVGWAMLFYTCALLSKPMSVAAIVLLPVFDLVAERRFAWRSLLILLIPAIAITLIHWKVDCLVHAAIAPVVASRWAAAVTMGPVWWRYLECCFNPAALSAVHDVSVRTASGFAGWTGWIAVVISCLASIRSWWRDEEPAWFAAWLTFFVPLIPVTQVFIPLQNRMADRYLCLSVLGLSWLIALVMRKFERVGPFAGVFLLVLFGAGTVWRAHLFSDSVALFSDATRKTTQSTAAPYLLGYAWEQRKNEPAARSAYEEVLRRNGQDEVTRSATNSLARLEVRRGALASAETILRKGIQQYPEDGKMRDNLIKVLFREGKVDEARHLFGLPPATAKPPASPKPNAPSAQSSEVTRHKHRTRGGSKPIHLF
jgi:hypothetical protein